MWKILWLCNSQFIDNRIKTTGTWLQPLAEMLQESNKVSIYNVTLGNVETIQHDNYKGIEQWILPHPKTKGHGQIPEKKFCQIISEIEEQVAPDLVHVWGSENVWASAYAQGAIKTKAFIDIQGILSSVYKYYYGGLDFCEILKCIHLKEILMPSRTLFYKKEVFRQRGSIESECLRKFHIVSYQSEWVKNIIFPINPNAVFIPTRIMLREGFYSAKPWEYRKNIESPVVFTTASGAIPYKGIHILFDSIKLLKRDYPNIQLRVAGQMKIGGLLIDGYSLYLQKKIQELGIVENVVFLGPLNEVGLIRELQNSNCCVIPSFVESYCLAFAESMMIGVPTIASFTSAMPELASHGKECLFYNSIDTQTCANYIKQLIEDEKLAQLLSMNARQKRLKENDREIVLQTQLDNYERIIGM